MPRYVSASLLADNAAFDRAWLKSADISEDTADTIVKSASKAGQSAAAMAKAAGASADEQEAAAARAAASYVEASEKISRAQQAAGQAAMTAAKLADKSADEQVAAFQKAVAATREYEDAQKSASDAAELAAKKQSDAAKAASLSVKGSMSSLASFGKDTLLAVGAGAAAAVYGGVKLQKQMEQLHTQAGVSQGAVNALTKSVLKLAGPLATSPTGLADSLYHVESAGFRGSQALNIMSLAAKAAKISGADLNDTTTALTATVFSGIKGAQNFASAMGLLNATVGAGDMKFQDLNEAFAGPMLATVKGYGLSLKDVGAALATFGDLNIRGADAATQLRMAVQYMAKPAATAGPLLEKLGLNTHSFADAMASGGLLPALQLLHDKLQALGVQGNQTAQVLGDIFSKKGAAGVTVLENNLTKLESKYQKLDDTAGASTFQKDWLAWTGTAAGQADKLEASVQALADKFGLYLIPKLEQVATAVENVVNWFQRNHDAAEALAAIIEGVLAAAVSAFVVEKVTAFVSGLKAMKNGLQAVGATLSTLPAKFGAVGAASKVAEDDVAASGAGMVESADSTAAGVDAAIGSTGIGAVFVGLGVALTELALHWQTVMGDLKSEAQKIVNPVVEAFDKITNKVENSNSLLNGYGSGFLGSEALGHGSRNPNAKSNSIYTGGGRSHGISSSSPPWVQLGISKAAYEKISPANRASLGLGTAGTGLTLSKSWLAASRGLDLSSGQQANAAAIMAALTRGGLSTAGAAALTGNWEQESSLNPGEPGGLLAQWGGQRLVNEQSYAAQHHEAYNTIPAETGFALQELQGSPGLLSMLKSGNLSPQQLALAVENKYEEPKGTAPNAGYFTPDTYWSANTGGREDYAASIYSAFSGKQTSGSDVGTSSGGLTSKQLDALLNGTTSANVTTGASISTTVANAVSKYKGLASSATIGAVKQMYQGVAAQIQALGPQFEAEAKGAGTSSQLSQIKDALSQAIAKITAGLVANISEATGATSLIGKYQSATQNGTPRSLETALGVRTTAGMSRHVRSQIEGMGWASSWQHTGPGKTWLGDTTQNFVRHRVNPSTGAIESGLMPTLGKAEQGSTANNEYLERVASLIASGQKAMAAQLVAAHKQAMQALAVEMYSEQKTKDGEELSLQATFLKDQAQEIEDYSQDELTVLKAMEQKVTDMAAAVVQSMQNQQTIVDDTMAGIAQQIKDSTAVGTDTSQSVVDAINDSTQTEVDQIGERGLYGLNLVAQQLQVQADQTKAYWDQQIDLAQKNLDTLQQQADLAENQGQVSLDTLTATQDLLVAQAQARLDTVTGNQDQRIATAQQHADAVTAHADATLIGPAQIAVDLNANASKSVQAKFAAQLAAATGMGTQQEANAQVQLQQITAGANTTIQQAQNAFDAVSDNANQLIQQAANNLSQITDNYNVAIANAQQQLTNTQNTAAQQEALAGSAVSTEQELASTQFAGSGLIINMYGADLSSPASSAQELGWAIRSANIQTV